MSIEVTTATAPASWACYLINGDATGFDYHNTPDDKAGDRDKAACDAWIEKLAAEGWCVVSTEDHSEPEFRHSNDAGTLPGDCLTYVLHRQKERPAFWTLKRLAAEMPVTAEQRHLALAMLGKLEAAYESSGFHQNPARPDALKTLAQFFGDIGIDD